MGEGAAPLSLAAVECRTGKNSAVAKPPTWAMGLIQNQSLQKIMNICLGAPPQRLKNVI